MRSTNFGSLLQQLNSRLQECEAIENWASGVIATVSTNSLSLNFSYFFLLYLILNSTRPRSNSFLYSPYAGIKLIPSLARYLSQDYIFKDVLPHFFSLLAYSLNSRFIALGTIQLLGCLVGSNICFTSGT